MTDRALALTPLIRPIGAVLATALLLSATTVTGAGQSADPNDALRLPPPAYPRAVAEMRAGRPAAALDALDQAPPAAGAETPPLERAILRAALLGRAGHPAEAEDAWREVIEHAVFMRTFARRALVDSLAGRGVPAEAEPILETLVGADAARHRDLLLRVAAAHVDAGTPDRAAAHYRRVLRVDGRGTQADAARLGLAAALEASGDTAGALATLREAQLRFRGGDAFVAARRESQRLAATRGAPLQPFAAGEYRTLVRRLRRAARYDAALRLLDDWAAAHPAAAAADHYALERVTTLYDQRDNAAAVAACAAFAERHPGSPLLPGVRLTDFRLAVRMGDTARARRLGLDLWEGRVAGATTGQRRAAALLLGAYLVAVGEVDGGLELYRGLFRTATAPDDQRSLLWRAAVAALRVGQHERALTNLRSLVNREPDGDLALAAQYWLAVARERTGDPGAAARGFGALAARYPYHYYGLTARQRLAELGGDAPAARMLDFPSLSVSAASRGRAEYRAAMALARAGFVEDAAWYLRRLLDRRRGDRGLALLAARASAAAGDHAAVSRVLANHFGGFLNRPARGLPADFWTLVYPRPFWDTVARSAGAHGVDPTLLVSLMRQESRFDPEARSVVGALGLLQVMPYTAEALAERAGVGHILEPDGLDEAALTDPGVNTAIAARLNADLLALFDGARAPVIASYNAGEERVAIWWEAARDLRQDFFVDSIPYSETRRFAREVLANYAAYRRIYGGE